jgi:sulfite reductase (ferredoxin)
VADLGFFAHMKNGVKGFSVYAAGGLGSNPLVAAKIEDFIRAEEIFEVVEAIKKLFDKYGDRTNKHKARLRYVLTRVGIEEFIKLYRTERDILKTEGLPYEAPQIRDISSLYKAPEKSVTVRLRLTNGDIPADDLSKVGQIASKYGQGLIRTTQLQDLLITGIAKEDVENVHSQLKKLSIDVFGDGSSKIVACAGASTCKLGLCLSRGLADAISEKFSHIGSSADLPETTIRISGCPNSCGHHYIGAIGFQGKAKRVNGKLMPCYDVLMGAKTVEGDAHLGKRIGTVPAKKIPELLEEAFEEGEIKEEKLTNLVGQYSDFSSEQFPADYYYDYGSNEPFSLAGRGPGECGAGVTDVIKLDIEEAKDALKSEPANSENIYKAVIAAARALLVTFGLEPKKDREIFAAFSKGLIEPGWVKPQTQQLLDEAIDWRMGDRESIEDLCSQAGDLTKRVEELYLSLDANLKFKIEPVAKETIVNKAEPDNHVIDLRGVECPLNFVKAKLELEKLQTGAILGVLLDDGEPVRNVPASFADQGQEVLEVKNSGDHFCVKVRRKK